jgi:uncharacterized protein YdhG (YjbR/CyaY superfamily)
VESGEDEIRRSFDLLLRFLERLGYGIPTFKLDNIPLAYFAAWKNHIGFYPMPSAAKAFKRELSVYKQGKGSIQFPLDKPIPYRLVNKIVEFRARDLVLSYA